MVLAQVVQHVCGAGKGAASAGALGWLWSLGGNRCWATRTAGQGRAAGPGAGQQMWRQAGTVSGATGGCLGCRVTHRKSHLLAASALPWRRVQCWWEPGPVVPAGGQPAFVV